MLAAGTLLDRYRIDGKLGEGGFGEVYRAFDLRLQRPVALKFLSEDDPGSNPEHRDRLLREARAAARIRHPNVVSIFDVGEVDGVAFIAMELVEGSSLRNHMRTDVPLARKLDWLVEIARALEVAHAQGLVHRDVKPDNILITEDAHAKVLDFGVAKRVIARPSEPPPSSVTADGRVRGTPKYMAPEQLLGREVDGRTDQFAWGIVAYELLSGVHPFEGLAPTTAEAILSAPIKPLGEVDPSMPENVQQVVDRTLRRKPAARFDSMQAVIDGLTTSMAEPTAVMDAAPAETSKTLVDAKPRQTSFVTALVVIAALAALGGTLFYASKRMKRSTTTSAPSATAIASARTPPRTNSADALGAYVAAMQASRDGATVQARVGLAHAITLDAAFAAAHLRLAALGIEDRPNDARRSYRRATELRTYLDTHDQTLMDALAPLLLSEPPNLPAVDTALADALKADPSDVELSFHLARVRLWRGDAEGAIAVTSAALSRDPKLGAMYYVGGSAHEARSDLKAARTMAAACLSAVPIAADCAYLLMRLDRRLGSCERLEADARAYIANNPETSHGYDALAEALFARNAPRAGVVEAMSQATQYYVTGKREAHATLGRAHLALVDGDFVTAEKHLLEYAAMQAGDGHVRSHGGVANTLVLLHRETGESSEAARIAEEFLAKKIAWVSSTKQADLAIVEDPTPQMLEVRFRAGTITRADLVAGLDAWTKAWQRDMPPLFARYLWVRGSVATVATREEAEASLRDMPKDVSTPDSLLPFAGAWVGRALVLAGRSSEALPWLERALGSCQAVSSPLPHVRTQLFLGLAREATGDVAGACRVYDEIVARWGKAKPTSVTAREARDRLAAACKR